MKLIKIIIVLLIVSLSFACKKKDGKTEDPFPLLQSVPLVAQVATTPDASMRAIKTELSQAAAGVKAAGADLMNTAITAPQVIKDASMAKVLDKNAYFTQNLGEEYAIIYFKGLDAKLTMNDEQIIKDTALAVQRKGGAVQISAHAAVGDSDAVKISQAYGKLVQDALIKAGIPASSVKLHVMGSAAPSPANPNDVRYNRRVEIYLQS